MMKINLKKKIIYIIPWIIVFFFTATIIISFHLFNAHPEIRVLQLDDIRQCTYYAKMLVKMSTIRNKIIFSYFWDDLKADLFKKNPDMGNGIQLTVDIDYVGYGILFGGNGTIKDLSPLERINMPGAIYFEETARFSPDSRLPGPDDRKFEIYLSQKRETFKSQYYDRAVAFWHSLDVELRMK